MDWKSLHRILSDDTRRSILELVAEKGALSYTEMMTILQITNTGRLNYHLKALSSLLAKDEEGRYRLTDQGRLAASLVHNFPERVPSEKRLSALKVTTSVVLILLGLFIVLSFVLPLLSTYGTVTSSTTARVSGASLLSPFLMLYTSIFLAIGVLLLVLAASILTKRVWR